MYIKSEKNEVTGIYETKSSDDINEVLTLQELTVSSNGEYLPSEGYDAIGKVIVSNGEPAYVYAIPNSYNNDKVVVFQSTNVSIVAYKDFETDVWTELDNPVAVTDVQNGRTLINSTSPIHPTGIPAENKGVHVNCLGNIYEIDDTLVEGPLTPID